MLKWLREKFSSNSSHKTEFAIEKKNKLLKDEFDDVDVVLYTHQLPQYEMENGTMPKEIEEPDVVNSADIQVLDENGKQIPMGSQQAAALMNRGVPDGLGQYGIKTNKNGRPPQQPPQPNMAPPQQPMQQQPMQQQPMAAPPQQPYGYPQGGYPPQQPYPPQGYPPQYPQGYPPQGQLNQMQQYPNVQAPQNIQVKQPEMKPPHEIVTLSGEYHLFVDLPGVSNVDMKFKDGAVIIVGDRTSAIDVLRKEKKRKNARKDPVIDSFTSVDQNLFRKFKYEFPFQKLIDETEIKATYENGIAHVILPHRAKGESVSISIQ